MTTQEQYMARLSVMVPQKFGRTISTIEDCEALGDAVAEATNIKLDARAYAPLFVEAQRGVAPRPVTLSTLARYLGYSSWGDFCNTTIPVPNDKTDLVDTPRRWGVIILTIVAIVVVVAAAALLVVMGGGESSTTEDSGEVRAVVTEVSERWMARTIERCNALRAYEGEEEYAERIDSFVTEYDAALKQDIEADIRAMSSQRGLSLRDAEVAHYGDSIAMRCRAMCGALRSECEL